MLEYYSTELSVNYLGFNYVPADEETMAKLKKMKKVRKMPCYPAQGSICMIDGTIVVKLEKEIGGLQK
ncbi:MAG: hypothetical protein Q4B01_10510 [Eubacteriales bacterium]|nr:hypothetical protein [Eubacteriales bacterium]